MLANPAARQDTDVSDHISDALSGLLEVSEHFECTEGSESDIQDNAPLLPDRCPSNSFDGVSNQPQAQAEIRGKETGAGTAVHEALAVLRLAAPVTIQVRALLTSVHTHTVRAVPLAIHVLKRAGYCSVWPYSEHTGGSWTPTGCE